MPGRQGPVYKCAKCLFTHAFLWLDAERRCSPLCLLWFSCTPLKEPFDSKWRKARQDWGQGEKHSTFGKPTHGISMVPSLGLLVHPKGKTRTTEQIRAQVTDQLYITAAIVYNFVGFRLCELACSESC